MRFNTCSTTEKVREWLVSHPKGTLQEYNKATKGWETSQTTFNIARAQMPDYLRMLRKDTVPKARKREDRTELREWIKEHPYSGSSEAKAAGFDISNKRFSNIRTKLGMPNLRKFLHQTKLNTQPNPPRVHQAEENPILAELQGLPSKTVSAILQLDRDVKEGILECFRIDRDVENREKTKVMLVRETFLTM